MTWDGGEFWNQNWNWLKGKVNVNFVRNWGKMS